MVVEIKLDEEVKDEIRQEIESTLRSMLGDIITDQRTEIISIFAKVLLGIDVQVKEESK